jgi:NADPH2:quinone reductase
MSHRRAVLIPRFGGPDVLTVGEVAVPPTTAGTVRVRVAAATVNPTDVALRSGAYRPNLPPPYIPGMELAGYVDEVGSDVTGLRVGDAVMAIVRPLRPEGGAQAEQVVVPAASVVPIPRGASMPEAATLPMNGLTARQILDLLALPPGRTLGVTGAAGAVGGYVIQLAKREGLRVVADAAPADEGLVRALGADSIVPRGPGVGRAMREAVPEGLDAVVDAALMGAAVLPAVRDGGQIAAVRAWTAGTVRGIVIRRVSVAEYAERRDALLELARLAETGVLTLRVADTMPPERVGDAHRRFEAGGVRGRLVLVFP